MKIKIEDVLKLDCRIPEQRKFLVDKFRNIPYIEENLEDPRDIKRLKEVTREFLENKGFSYNTLTFHERRFYTLAVYDKINKNELGSSMLYTLYALDKKEMYIKLCVFAHYFRKANKKNRKG